MIQDFPDDPRNLRTLAKAPAGPGVSIPVALVKLVVTGKGRHWQVDNCPLCGGVHRHGAGTGVADPDALLGHRVAHCTRGSHGTINPGYVLVRR